MVTVDVDWAMAFVANTIRTANVAMLIDFVIAKNNGVTMHAKILQRLS